MVTLFWYYRPTEVDLNKTTSGVVPPEFHEVQHNLYIHASICIIIIIVLVIISICALAPLLVSNNHDAPRTCMTIHMLPVNEIREVVRYSHYTPKIDNV